MGVLVAKELECNGMFLCALSTGLGAYSETALGKRIWNGEHSSAYI